MDKVGILNQIIEQNISSKEDKIQKVFENVFAELFGYSKSFGEIDSQRSIQIGSKERVIPDIIIRDSISKKDLFIVELKQLNLPFDSKYAEQLHSYMNLLNVNVGILICKSIYICYKENDKFTDVILFEDGRNIDVDFINMFSKSKFDANSVYMKIVQIKNIKLIKNQLNELNIKELVKTSFSDRFSTVEIESALQDYEFSVEKKCKINSELYDDAKSYTKEINYPIKDSKKQYIYNGETVLGKIVLNIVKDYASKNKCSFEELVKVFPKELQGSLGVVQLVNEAKVKCSDYHKRYYIKQEQIIELTDGQVCVCNQWKGSVNFQLFLNRAKEKGYDIQPR